MKSSRVYLPNSDDAERICMLRLRQYLTEDATKTLVNAFILPRLDYCNSLLAGYPQTVIKPLQQVQNSAAKLILKSRRAEHAKHARERGGERGWVGVSRTGLTDRLNLN